MATTSYTQDDITKLERALINMQGAVEIRIADRMVRFETPDKIEALLARLRRLVNSENNGTRYAATRKGV